jgi:hypothetical protein
MALIPKAAALYRKQIADGLDGDPEAATIARASGALRASLSLAKQLAAAEEERERLQAEQKDRAAGTVSSIFPRVAERYLGIVARLEEHLRAIPSTRVRRSSRRSATASRSARMPRRV